MAQRVSHFIVAVLSVAVSTPIGATAPPDLASLSTSKPVADFISKNESKPDWLTESCIDFEHCSTFNYHRKDYTLSGDAHAAFKKMMSMHGPDLWHGSSQFSLMYDPKTKSYYDSKSNHISSFEVGQVYFLDLTILKKLHMPVAFKITEIDYAHMTLSYSYVKSNKSQGIQRFKFVQKPNGQFVVEHETRFKSASKLRDALLYRKFHEKLLDDFYDDFQVALLNSALVSSPGSESAQSQSIYDGTRKLAPAPFHLRDAVPVGTSDTAD